VRLAELRQLVPRENAIAGIDLAEDNQASASGHDAQVRRPARGGESGEDAFMASDEVMERVRAPLRTI
jgi:hypothetical protein